MGRAKNNKKISIIDSNRLNYMKKNHDKFTKTTCENFDWKAFEKIAKGHKDTIEAINISAETGISLPNLCKYGVIKRVTPTPFDYDFTREQIEKLTEIFNLYISEMPFKVSVKQVETIFTTHEYIGYMRVKNRPLAFMFDELSTKGMVCNNWQEVIEKNGLFASKSGKKLKAKDLSVALSRYKSDEWNRSFTKSPMKEPYKSIREAISLL